MTEDDIKAPSDQFDLPPSLKFLRHLVTVLTAVMIVGVVLIITLLVIRLNDTGINLPQSITLPDGTIPIAFSQTPNWYSVITNENEILIFDLNGDLKQKIAVQN